jgi:hypothetical protein
MDQNNRNRSDEDQTDRNRTDENLDDEMERDTQIRRDTQVRGSLGLPPSGEESSSDRSSRDDSIPEFERGDDTDRNER